eukprot:COSAG01_NODE_7647_length_3115_cov_1.557692_4_plen_133_part_00
MTKVAGASGGGCDGSAAAAAARRVHVRFFEGHTEAEQEGVVAASDVSGWAADSIARLGRKVRSKRFAEAVRAARTAADAEAVERRRCVDDDCGSTREWDAGVDGSEDTDEHEVMVIMMRTRVRVGLAPPTWC